MKRNNKGFTLAEMLIVVAIIGILIAITTLTITNLSERAKEATDLANIRSACSEMEAIYLFGDYNKKKFEVYTAKDGTGTKYVKTYVNCVSREAKWQSSNIQKNKDGYAIVCGALLIAPTENKPSVRIRLNMDTGVFDFNPEAADNGKRVGVYNR